MGKMNEMINILFMEADLLNCSPRDERELARLCGWKSRTSTWTYFGPKKDHPPKEPEVLEKVCKAFSSAGIEVRPKWFELSKDEFEKG